MIIFDIEMGLFLVYTARCGLAATHPVFIHIHSADTLRIVTPLRINIECSSVKIWNKREILCYLKKTNMKIDAF